MANGTATIPRVDKIVGPATWRDPCQTRYVRRSGDRIAADRRRSWSWRMRAPAPPTWPPIRCRRSMGRQPLDLVTLRGAGPRRAHRGGTADGAPPRAEDPAVVALWRRLRRHEGLTSSTASRRNTGDRHCRAVCPPGGAPLAPSFWARPPPSRWVTTSPGPATSSLPAARRFFAVERTTSLRSSVISYTPQRQQAEAAHIPRLPRWGPRRARLRCARLSTARRSRATADE